MALGGALDVERFGAEREHRPARRRFERTFAFERLECTITRAPALAEAVPTACTALISGASIDRVCSRTPALTPRVTLSVSYTSVGFAYHGETHRTASAACAPIGSASSAEPIACFIVPRPAAPRAAHGMCSSQCTDHSVLRAERSLEIGGEHGACGTEDVAARVMMA